MSRPTAILFLVTEDWYFWSHRLNLARACRDRGWRVTVATRVDRHGEAIVAEGFELVPLGLRRRGRNPVGETAAILEILRLYRRVRPDIVHQVALKPALYGTLAARLAGVPVVVNALAGLGYVFASDEAAARRLRPAVTAAFRLLLDRPGQHVIVQNPDDRRLLVDAGTVGAKRISIIRGSGVDCEHFRPTPEPPGPPVAALVARMLWDKGVGEAVEAADILRRDGAGVRVVLVGRPDPDNPRAVPTQTLRQWNDGGRLEWWGHRDDVAAVWAEAHMAILPTTYGEGLPKCLLEAAACGRPLIATDAPGCRELVEDGVTGLLVPPRDPAALAAAVRRLAEDADLRRQLGAAARRAVVERFSDAVIVGEVMELYDRLLAAAGRVR
ncbi:MAG: glycosyltransferase family 4 protein [Rhodospirillales bacterium]|nr:glycosyltransferase family 4 protein [Rhodospirillales bacterium]